MPQLNFVIFDTNILIGFIFLMVQLGLVLYEQYEDDLAVFNDSCLLT